MAWHSELETQQVRPVTCHQILQNYDSKLYTAMSHEIPSEAYAIIDKGEVSNQ